HDLKQIEETCQAVAQLVGMGIEVHQEVHGGPPVLFALLMFTEGSEGWATYASNAQREDMIRALEEMAAKLKKGLDRHG
ncbi:MAG: hypothetical protein WBG86_14570, partial [Polyangiales bacterium]